MSRKGMDDRSADRGAAGKAAPGSGSREDDVKVPVEVGEDATDRADAATSQPGPAAAVAPEQPVEDEQAKVEAAIRAGERAAEEDFRSDSERLRRERDELAKKLAGVGDEVKAAKEAAADSADRLTRLQADWDNYRRRTASERLAERDRATEKLVTSLLPVIDDMERAIGHASVAADGDENLRQFSDGVEAVHAKMVDVLAKEGVEVIDPTGEPFEPLSHQAVGRVEDKDSYEETVHDVYQRGYRMGGKVIRPAMVTVTYGGAKRPVEEPASETTDEVPRGADSAAATGGPQGDAPAEGGSVEG